MDADLTVPVLFVVVDKLGALDEHAPGTRRRDRGFDLGRVR